MPFYLEDGEKTLHYSNPPCHGPLMRLQEPNRQEITCVSISCLTVMLCLFSGEKYRIDLKWCTMYTSTVY